MGCGRWPEHLRLRSSEGELVIGRCKATNLCRYCQLLYVLETVEMLLLDAAEYAPTLWAVLTAREHLTRAQCRRHLDAVKKAVKRRWPAAEWFVQVEFQRRGALHLNLLIKGVPVEDRQELHDIISDRWCARVDAEPVGQWMGEVAEFGGIAKYLAKTLSHGLKAEQAPPIGWRGHRTSQTRGYFVRPASVMREEAKASRRLQRALRRAIKAGHQGHDAELVAHEIVAIEEATTWELVQVPRHPRPLSEYERQGLARVPWYVLEAAFRWEDTVAVHVRDPVRDVDGLPRGRASASQAEGRDGRLSGPVRNGEVDHFDGKEGVVVVLPAPNGANSLNIEEHFTRNEGVRERERLAEVVIGADTTEAGRDRRRRGRSPGAADPPPLAGSAP